MIDQLMSLAPDITYLPGQQFCWSPKHQTITYIDQQTKQENKWALLHETGHALLGHQQYITDFELIKMEMAAWDKALELAKQLSLTIPEDHIQDCLDSYRDWLYKRCICPVCNTKTIQKDSTNQYYCFNCHAGWQVSDSRFCRTYRTSTGIQQFIAI